MKQVIHIFGASGSGTSTLGHALSEAFGCKHMDTDDYFWLPTDPKYTCKRPVEERLFLMERDIEQNEAAVISGSLTGWGDGLIPHFTLCIRLVTDTSVRIERLKKREREKFGARLDAGGDMHEAHLAFLEWASKYDAGDENMRSLKKHILWQEKLSCPVIVLDGAAELEKNVESVRAYVKSMNEN